MADSQLQQINLYTQAFRPVREPLMAVHIASVIAGLIFVMFIVSAWSLLQKHNFEATAAQLNVDLVSAERRLQLVRAQQRQSLGPRIDREINQLQGQVSKRQNIKTLIHDQNLGNAQGFSAQLTAMAEESIEDLSVQAFSLQGGGAYLSINGWTKYADAVPRYLQMLRSKASFEETRLGVLTVERRQVRSDALYFDIAPAPAELEAEVVVIPTPVAMLQELNKEVANEAITAPLAE